jgi:hypothetical protein
MNESHFFGTLLAVAVAVADAVDDAVAEDVIVDEDDDEDVEVALAVALAVRDRGAAVDVALLDLVGREEIVAVETEVSETEYSGLRLGVNESLLDKHREKVGVADTHVEDVAHIVVVSLIVTVALNEDVTHPE